MWEELYRLYLQMRRQYSKNKFVENIQHRSILLYMCLDGPSSGRRYQGKLPATVKGNFRHRCRHLLHVSLCCAQIDENPPTQVSYFLPELEAKYETEYYVLDEENKEFEQALSFIKQKKSTLGSWQIDLWPHPTNISSLPSDKNGGTMLAAVSQRTTCIVCSISGQTMLTS